LENNSTRLALGRGLGKNLRTNNMKVEKKEVLKYIDGKSRTSGGWEKTLKKAHSSGGGKH